jgi:hypothetical protein
LTTLFKKSHSLLSIAPPIILAKRYAAPKVPSAVIKRLMTISNIERKSVFMPNGFNTDGVALLNTDEIKDIGVSDVDEDLDEDSEIEIQSES